MPENIQKLYSSLVQELGHEDFQFQITGGDRYIKDGKVYSSTNNSLIGKSGPAHIRGDAVDLRIKLKDNSDIIPYETVKTAVKGTDFIFDPKALPEKYPDKHYHLQFPKGYKK